MTIHRSRMEQSVTFIRNLMVAASMMHHTPANITFKTNTALPKLPLHYSRTNEKTRKILVLHVWAIQLATAVQVHMG